MSKKIFISHRTEDAVYANALKNFLCLIEISKNEIFCSSLQGHGVEDEIRKEVREALNDSKMDIVLLSEAYLESIWCISELGAIWFKSKDENNNRIYITLPGFSRKNIRGVVNNDPKFYELNNIEDIDVMVEKVRTVFPEIISNNVLLNSYIRDLANDIEELGKEHGPLSENQLFQKRTLYNRTPYEGTTADVVGIGAINFDFIFALPENEKATDQAPPENEEAIDQTPSNQAPGGGEERLEGKYKQVKNRILRNKERGYEYILQLGGASLNAIKTINSIKKDLKKKDNFPTLAYVGITGNIPNEIQLKFKEVLDYEYIKKELEYLDIKDWIIETNGNGNSGLGFFELRNGYRVFGQIGQGINKDLVPKLKERLLTTGTDRNAFVKFLSAAQWVHISSLADFNQFKIFVDVIEQAKKINQALMVSFDPGSDYMINNTAELAKMFYLSDYVFLSKTEYSKHGFSW